jgi:hypothetical protein
MEKVKRVNRLWIYWNESRFVYTVEGTGRSFFYLSEAIDYARTLEVE